MNKKENRNFDLDILRSAGLFLIILAHCQPVDLLFQLRNFDVPLMVIVSAATFSMLYKNTPLKAKTFYIKRIKRLILPTWYFLTFFFGSIFIGSYIIKMPYPFSLNEIISSFFLYWGIGYVWILRIFLFVTILTPPLLLFKDKIKNNTTYATIIIISYMIYEIIASNLYSIDPANEELGILGTIFLPIIPYAALYAYGLKFEELSNKTLILIALITFFIFAVLGFYYYRDTGGIVPTQHLKYPPQLYYLSYAILMTNVLYLIVRNFYPKSLLKDFWTWISSNSLWIYLWHIYAIFIWDYLFLDPDKSFIISMTKYSFVCLFSIMLVMIQNMFLQIIKNDTKQKV